MCTRIVNEIEQNGPLPFSRFMQMALSEPGLGYYVNGLHKFGASGDFITAPESGSLFARAVARTLADRVHALETDWTLLELGPGSGALAADLLAMLPNPPRRYLLLEPSAMLQEIQQERLNALPSDLRDRVRWLEQPPDKAWTGVVLANEVIDALPVERFRKGVQGFEQLCVNHDQNGLQWCTQPASKRMQAALDRLAPKLPADLPDGYVSELCIDLSGWLDTVLGRLERGLAMFFDYGYPRHEYYHPDRREGTLICHYRHRAHFDPFVWPGLTDLSAFVDFSAVADAVRGLGFTLGPLCRQADFMIESSVHEMIEGTEDEFERLRLAAEFKRLVLPGEMGETFKVLTMTRNADEMLPFGAATPET